MGTHLAGSQERPRAVSEYLIERMVEAGTEKICFVISPGKSDIMNYFGGSALSAKMFYAVQQRPEGLCDAIFCALPLIPADEEVCIGLPDTIWFPPSALRSLPEGVLSLLLFPVEHPERFDAVVTSSDNRVSKILVKSHAVETNWVWGALRMPGWVLTELHRIWLETKDEYVGTLINTYLDRGGRALGLKLGECYVDVGTLNGYREALRVLDSNCVTPERS